MELPTKGKVAKDKVRKLRPKSGITEIFTMVKGYNQLKLPEQVGKVEENRFKNFLMSIKKKIGR